MYRQDETLVRTTDDDTEGHMYRGETEGDDVENAALPLARGDDTEGHHFFSVDEGDDTGNSALPLLRGVDDDTEGHHFF
jgi:hypothetical protein